MRWLQAALAAAVLAAPARADDAQKQALPEIPDRYQVSGYANDRDPAVDKSIFNDKTTIEQVRDILLDPRESDPRRAQAAIFWSGQITDAYYGPRPHFWKAVELSFDLLDRLFHLPAGSYARRYAIFAVFSNLSAQTRGAIIEQPSDRAWAPHWNKTRTYVERGLRDRDPKLREFFERFILLPRAPDWKAAKASARRTQDRLLAAYPADREKLADVWRVLEDHEKQQLAEKDKWDRYIRKQKIDAKLKQRLLRYQAHIYDYRLTMHWSSVYPRILREGMEDKTADALGIKIAPVKNGWPLL